MTESDARIRAFTEAKPGLTEMLRQAGFDAVEFAQGTMPIRMLEALTGLDIIAICDSDEVAHALETLPYVRVATSYGSFGILIRMRPLGPLLDLHGTGITFDNVAMPSPDFVTPELSACDEAALTRLRELFTIRGKKEEST